MDAERRLPPLNALRALEAAARLGSLSAASDELAVTPGAISQQIRQLELALGVTLFRRKGRGVELTEEARAALPALSEGFERLRRAADALRGGDVRADVVLRAPLDFAVKWLVPRLAAFDAADRKVRIILVAGDPGEGRSEGGDLEIRYGPGRYPGVECRRLIEETATPVASPLYLARLALPLDARALAEATLLHDRSPGDDPRRPGWAEWFAARGVEAPSVGRGHRFSRADAVVEAAVAGCGVGLVRRTLAQAELAAGRLISVASDGVIKLDYGYDVIWPAGRRLSAPQAAALSWLQGEAAQYEYDLGGL